VTGPIFAQAQIDNDMTIGKHERMAVLPHRNVPRYKAARLLMLVFHVITSEGDQATAGFL
jgi:hypothetical protein